MLADRDYMRPPSPSPAPVASPAWPLTVWLVILNVAVFTAQQIVPPMDELALYPVALLRGAVWQLITFQFLHASLFHLLINCFMLYVFGRPLEAALGKVRFLVFYLASGVAGGLLQSAAGLAFRKVGVDPVVGASAGVFGLVAAFAVLNWNRPLTLLLAFVLPVTLKAKWLLIAEGGIALLGMLRPGQIAHAAHLGGLLAGVGFALSMLRRQGNWASPSRARASLRNVASSRTASGTRAAASLPPVVVDDEFMSREVDPILDKISAQGIQSLTESEKRILEAARSRIGGR